MYLRKKLLNNSVHTHHHCGPTLPGLQICWEHRVPLFVTSVCGMVGFLRIQVMIHTQ